MTATPAERAHEAHPQTPSTTWKAHEDAVKAHVLNSADERARRLREETDATEYHRNAEQPKGS